MAVHPIRPIRDRVGYENALEVADRLAGRENLTRDQEDYFDLLTDQIEKYEDEHYPIDTSNITPLEMVKFLLEENGMHGSDLGRLLGQRQLGNAILRGERQLSKTHIKKLAEHFQVDAGLFLE